MAWPEGCRVSLRSDCENLAELTHEQWNEVVRGAEERWCRIGAGGTPLETDIVMTMGAVGTRGKLLEAGAEGGLDLALKSAAMWIKMKSDKADGLSAAQADVTHNRDDPVQHLIREGPGETPHSDSRKRALSVRAGGTSRGVHTRYSQP